MRVLGSLALVAGLGTTIWSRSTSWRWSVMPAGSRAHKATRSRHSGPHSGRFSWLGRHVGSRRLLDHVLDTAYCHVVPVQAFYPAGRAAGDDRRISHHLLRSDHSPFWRAGLPALMWTDTAEFRNPHYHQSTDTPETLDYEFLAGVTRLLVHAVLSEFSAD